MNKTELMKRQSVLNLSEAARSLGVAQEKGDQGAIEYWSDMVTRFETEVIQSAEQQPRSDALVVEQTEQIAALLAKAFHGSQLTEGVTFRDCESPKAKQCWDIACHIQEELTATDVENALAELDCEQPAEQQPAPDVAQLVGALETVKNVLESNDPAIAYTVWVPGVPGAPETLLDHVCAALAAHRKHGDEV